MKKLSGNRLGYEVSVCQGRISGMVQGLFDGHHTGRIHSCFRTGLNLLFGDRLIHLDDGEHGLCCFGMTVAAREMKQILMCCGAGDLAVYRDGSLRLYGRGGVVQLELSRFSSVDLAIWQTVQAGQKKMPDSAQDGFSILQEKAEGYILGLEKDETFRFYTDILSGDEAMERTALFPEAVHFFVGRGQGLTPAGDDILTGYGAVLQCAGKAGALIRALQDDRLQTTDVSRAYLDAMAQGFANELFVRLLEQLWGGDTKRFQETLKQMERIGHTSGCDTLYGMYLGLKKMKEDTQL